MSHPLWMMTNQPIKFYEIINWLIGPDDKLPQRFIEQRSKLNSTVPYLIEQFWGDLQLTQYLNFHLNDLFNIKDPLEVLVFLKKIIKTKKLSKGSLYSGPRVFREPDLVKEIIERENYDEGNASAKAMMIKYMDKVDQTPGYFKPAATKANIKKLQNDEDKKVIESAIQMATEEITKENNTKFITTLTQEYILENELVLFDITLLKKTNQVLLIFIDKNNSKQYYKEDFQAEIFLSKRSGVINNDYVVSYDKNIHEKYIIRNITDYNKLKFMLNNNYKYLVNGA